MRKKLRGAILYTDVRNGRLANPHRVSGLRFDRRHIGIWVVEAVQSA